MERVLKAVPADLRVKMEALVHDLTLALEESSNSANVRRRWGIRRRARSTGNIRKCQEINMLEDNIFFSKKLFVPIFHEQRFYINTFKKRLKRIQTPVF